ncbi:MAG: cytochrome c [Chitinophagaceae bacterium]
MRKLVILGLFAGFVIACGDSNSPATSDKNVVTAEKSENKNPDENPSYDPKRGEGKFTKVELAPTLDAAKAESGNKIYGVKCSGCHKTTDEKLVGPGWSGVTSRHAPEWIMNFITNTDAMINKDPKVQAQLELCLIRMPNQNLSDEDARNLLEFMRKNDGLK